jgi:uncharacterized protein
MGHDSVTLLRYSRAHMNRSLHEPPSIYDHALPVSWRSAPRTFVSLMTLYESNYVRLRQLVGELTTLADVAVSEPTADCALRLSVEERGRYTTTFTLTYLFDDQGVSTAPDLLVRVYHDAKLVEAMSSANGHRHPVLDALRTQLNSELDNRWRRNTMLNKWLEYCADRGHRFDASHRVASGR